MQDNPAVQPPAVLITGAGRGLGRGIAVEAAARGWSAVINYAGNEKTAAEAAELCRSAASSREQKFLTVKADISDREQRGRLIESCFDAFGAAFRGLVNNAGVAPLERLDILEAGEESFDRLMSINLKGPWFLTRDISARWLAEGTPNAKIVFVSSISAAMVSTGRGEYCVSKAGIAMAAQLFAARLAAEDIQVYEVRPGIMATDMTAGVKSKYDALIADGLVPQGRWGTPEDTGRAVASLLEGDFPFSPGSVFYVDGGIHIPRL